MFKFISIKPDLHALVKARAAEDRKTMTRWASEVLQAALDGGCGCNGAGCGTPKRRSRKSSNA